MISLLALLVSIDLTISGNWPLAIAAARQALNRFRLLARLLWRVP